MKKIPFILAALLLGVHFFLGLKPIRHYAPTYDEPVHLAAGASYWKTSNYRVNGYGHTPFSEMWAAFPLNFLNPLIPVQHPSWLRQTWRQKEIYLFADKFFYANRVDWKKMLESSRLMMLLLSLLFGLFLGWAGWKTGGVSMGLCLMGLWAFSPTILAHSTLVATDFCFSVFFFMFFYFLQMETSWKTIVLRGVALGLCVASKFFALILGPCLLVLFIWRIRKERFVNATFLRNSLSVGAIAFAVLLLNYKVTEFDVFIKGLQVFLSLAGGGRSSFLMGEHGATGWVTYFPIAFLIKTPIPVLLAFVFSLVLLVRKKISLPAALLIPPLIYFVLVSFSKVQIGHRYILAVYPFVFFLCAKGLASLQGRGRFILIPFFLWLAGGTIHAAPHFLPYFNEFIGGPQNGYKYLTDSNVDWGQDLQQLKPALEPADIKNGIFLSYFGVADPSVYGLRVIDIGSTSITDRKDNYGEPGLAPTKMAISATHLQATYYSNRDFFNWAKEMTSWKRVGHGLFIYDLKNYPERIQALWQFRTFQARQAS